MINSRDQPLSTATEYNAPQRAHISSRTSSRTLRIGYKTSKLPTSHWQYSSLACNSYIAKCWYRRMHSHQCEACVVYARALRQHQVNFSHSSFLRYALVNGQRALKQPHTEICSMGIRDSSLMRLLEGIEAQAPVDSDSPAQRLDPSHLLAPSPRHIWMSGLRPMPSIKHQLRRRCFANPAELIWTVWNG